MKKRNSHIFFLSNFQTFEVYVPASHIQQMIFCSNSVELDFFKYIYLYILVWTYLKVDRWTNDKMFDSLVKLPQEAMWTSFSKQLEIV